MLRYHDLSRGDVIFLDIDNSGNERWWWSGLYEVSSVDRAGDGVRLLEVERESPHQFMAFNLRWVRLNCVVVGRVGFE